jgi:hypothetical protein
VLQQQVGFVDDDARKASQTDKGHDMGLQTRPCTVLDGDEEKLRRRG